MSSVHDNPMSQSPTSLAQRWRETCWTWHERADWAEFAGADWRDTILAAEMTDDFHSKQGRSTGRWLLRSGSQTLSVYLKRHYQLPWWRGLLATLWPRAAWSPGLEEFHHLQTAQRLEIPTPAIVAAGQAVGPHGRLQSVLAIEELTGKLALHQAIPLAQQHLDAPTFRRWKRGLIAELARLAHLLHDKCFFHKDLYLCHFYVARADCLEPRSEWRERVWMIDFHRLARHRFTWPNWLVKDLGGLLFSTWNEGIDVRDRLYFWKCYVGGKPSVWQRILRRLVTLKGRRYLDHNEKLQARKAA